jgi:outer membrane protein assembly factor BamB
MSVAAIAASAALLVTASWAQDWRFRGPGGTGVFEDARPPVRWSETENLRWKCALPGRGLSNPVVAGDRIFVTACTGPEQNRLHVLAIDGKSGKRLWERVINATGLTGCHPKTSMAAPTPCTDGRRVYALFGTTDLVCYDVDGNLIWYRSLVRDYPSLSNQVGMAASAVLAEDVLLLAMDNAGESFVVAVDKVTGANRWKFDRTREINWTTPVVVERAGKAEAIFQTRFDVVAYDVKSGKVNWKHEAKGLSSAASPTAAEGLILAPGGELTALKPAAGKVEVAWAAPKMKTGHASPLVYRGRVYTVSAVGVLSCCDLKDGNVLWQERLKGAHSASPMAADGRIYVLSEEGTVSVINPESSERVMAVNVINDVMLASPVPMGDALLLRSDKFLYCVGEKK